jgi:hypothetical protein
VAFVLIESSDTLFQSKQRFVNLGSVDARLLVGIHCVRPSLRPGKIDKADFPMLAITLLDVDLHNRMST